MSLFRNFLCMYIPLYLCICIYSLCKLNYPIYTFLPLTLFIKYIGHGHTSVHVKRLLPFYLLHNLFLVVSINECTLWPFWFLNILKQTVLQWMSTYVLNTFGYVYLWEKFLELNCLVITYAFLNMWWFQATSKDSKEVTTLLTLEVLHSDLCTSADIRYSPSLIFARLREEDYLIFVCIWVRG